MEVFGLIYLSAELAVGVMICRLMIQGDRLYGRREMEW